MSNPNPILVDGRQGAELLCVSLRTFVTLAKDPGFPAARSLGSRATRWVRAELEAYAVALPPLPIDRDEPAPLTAARAARRAGHVPAPAPFGGQL